MGLTLYVYKAKSNDDVNKVITKKPKYSFRKYWFVYDYCIKHFIAWHNDDIAKIDVRALKDMVNYFNDIVAKCQFTLRDEIMEYKDFLKRIKSLQRYIKDDEIIYFEFNY